MEEIKRVKIHFMYVVIILVLAIIVTLSSVYFAEDSAWLFLAFAGTAVSIVLSVVAILITLIDVAGQRQQIADIAESAKILKETADSQAENYNNLDEIVETTINKVVSEQLSQQKEDMRTLFSESIDNLDLKDEKIEELRMKFDNFIESYKPNPTRSKVSIGRIVRAFKLEKNMNKTDYWALKEMIDYNSYIISKPIDTSKNDFIILRTKSNVETSARRDNIEVSKIENYLKKHGYLE